MRPFGDGIFLLENLLLAEVHIAYASKELSVFDAGLPILKLLSGL